MMDVETRGLEVLLKTATLPSRPRLATLARLRCGLSWILGWTLLFTTALTGCSHRVEPPEQRAKAAKVLFDETLRTLHLPSAGTNDVQRVRMLAEAARNYEQLIREYPEQSNLCAQAWRSLGNVRASQTNLDGALRCYSAVAERYPAEDWEVLQSWKSAGDLLWDVSRYDEARRFYSQLVTRFDATNAAPVVRLAVRGAKARLAQ